MLQQKICCNSSITHTSLCLSQRKFSTQTSLVDSLLVLILVLKNPGLDNGKRLIPLQEKLVTPAEAVRMLTQQSHKFLRIPNIFSNQRG